MLINILDKYKETKNWELIRNLKKNERVVQENNHRQSQNTHVYNRKSTHKKSL